MVPQSHCESKHISIDRLRVPSKILTVTNNFCCKTFSLIQCIYSEQMLDTTQTHSLTTQMAPKWMAKTRNICGWMNACADLLAHQQEKRSCKTNWQNNLLLRYFGTSLRSMCRVRTAIPRELNEIPFQTVPLSSLFNSQKMNFQLVCCFVTQLKSIDSVNVIFYWSFTSRTALWTIPKARDKCGQAVLMDNIWCYGFCSLSCSVLVFCIQRKTFLVYWNSAK